MTTSSTPDPTPSPRNYYELLGVVPSASPQDIRQAYREMSKLYHPDTTRLPTALATEKFQQLNEAYATLSNPNRRLHYDFKIGYSRVSVMQPSQVSNRTTVDRSSAYLDPTDRPLSAGELFALFSLAVTFLGCLLLAVVIGIVRGEVSLQTPIPVVETTSTTAPSSLFITSDRLSRNNPGDHHDSYHAPMAFAPPLDRLDR